MVVINSNKTTVVVTAATTTTSKHDASLVVVSGIDSDSDSDDHSDGSGCGGIPVRSDSESDDETLAVLSTTKLTCRQRRRRKEEVTVAGVASDSAGPATLASTAPAETKTKHSAAAAAASTSDDKTDSSIRSINYARLKSILFMSCASAVHLGGFEIARGASFALFTSQKTGFTASTSPSASPLSTVCMAPFSLGLFWLYTRCLDRYGPHKSVYISTVVFAVMLAVCGWILYLIDPYLSPTSEVFITAYHQEAKCSSNNNDDDDKEDYHNISTSLMGRDCLLDNNYDYTDLNGSQLTVSSQQEHVYAWKRLAQTITFFLYVASSAFFQLLYTQHWSFLGSVLGIVDGSDDSSNKTTDVDAQNNDNKDNDSDSDRRPQSSVGTMWFAPIAGFGSVSSTATGLCLPYIIERCGLTGTLSVAATVLLLSGACADRAYRIALKNGFEPGHFNKCHSKHKKKEQGGNSDSNFNDNSESLIQASVKLFNRVPILASLSLEVLASQSVSSIIHFLFVLEVQQSIPDDVHRASWTGRCYAWMNACSGVLQFFILPMLMRSYTNTNCKSKNGRSSNSRILRCFWLTMPVTMMICTGLLIYCNNERSLTLVTATFSLNKVMEWSVRGVAMETLYASLDYESQFLGKELISMVVDRVGRSSTAVAVSFITSVFGLSAVLDKAFLQALSVSSVLWLMASYPLFNHYNSHHEQCRPSFCDDNTKHPCKQNEEIMIKSE